MPASLISLCENLQAKKLTVAVEGLEYSPEDDESHIQHSNHPTSQKDVLPTLRRGLFQMAQKQLFNKNAALKLAPIRLDKSASHLTSGPTAGSLLLESDAEVESSNELLISSEDEPPLLSGFDSDGVADGGSYPSILYDELENKGLLGEISSSWKKEEGKDEEMLDDA